MDETAGTTGPGAADPGRTQASDAGPPDAAEGPTGRMLTIENATKVFKTGAFGGGEFTAVRDVSFGVAPREVVSLVGESGSGKTTIGRMILRLSAVTRGRITFDGVDVSGLRRRGLKEYYRKVQGVFQDPFSSYNPIFKADRVFSIIRDEYFPEVGDAAWRDKIEASLDAVSLNPGDVLHKFPHQLSGGQLQRLLIARALLLDIRLLVADEIISMLDASTRIDVLNLLGDLKSRGLGVIFITHDLSLGNYISDKTVILRRGRIVEMGPTTKVFGNPTHPYTRSLLAAVPQLHRRWEDVAAELQLRGANGAGELAPGAARGPEAPVPGAAPPVPERYSRSDSHPLRWPGPVPAGPRRGARHARAAVASAPEEVPEPEQVLVEVEPGHFVSRPRAEAS
ncbi:MAG TPA: ATP-binding cassette domain-containing protein [Acidimicrobiales bacterium]|nr:ATP-binding cassette domain-containing protein [Acidimicrobiales bacterium]